jgi:dTDP-glucose pyrophosphorylase
MNRRSFGIVFGGPDGILRDIVEKPDLSGRQLANIGAYLFPKRVFDIPLTLSPRNEYEITEAVGALAKSGEFHIVEATFWLPIGTVDAWNSAQSADLSSARQE